MTVGVLLMAYGTPRDRADIAAFYTDVRRGRPPSAEQLAELTARYDATGGVFPLRRITEAQAARLQAALQARAGGRFTVATGFKHAEPRIEDGVHRLAGRGVQRVTGLVLAPHHAAASVGEYADRAATAGTSAGLPVRTVPSWHLLPEYLNFLASAVADAGRCLPAGTEVVFTAHSLPVRAVPDGGYPRQLAATAAAVAGRLGLPRWSVAWQSAGRTADTWLGPDLRQVIRNRADHGVPGVLVCPCGFVADHLEVRYDLDIEARAVAQQVGVAFARTRTVNEDQEVLDGLAGLVTAWTGPDD